MDQLKINKIDKIKIAQGSGGRAQWQPIILTLPSTIKRKNVRQLGGKKQFYCVGATQKKWQNVTEGHKRVKGSREGNINTEKIVTCHQ